MPFTLAHPAAVLPLRRSKYFVFIPLVIGSLAPDLVDFLPVSLLSRLPGSHSVIGTVIVDLPFGLLALAAFLLLQNPITAPLWEPHRSYMRAAIARLQSRTNVWRLAVPSVLVGSWTHFFWDSFTHRSGWMVRHFTFLQRPLMPTATHHWEIFHALQYLSSAVGLAILAAWYIAGLRQSGFVGTGRIWRKGLLAMLVVASLAAGLAVLSFQPALETFSNYLMFSIVLNSAMACFAVLYLSTGIAITSLSSLRDKKRSTDPLFVQDRSGPFEP